jgi:hypothetical protein
MVMARQPVPAVARHWAVRHRFCGGCGEAPAPLQEDIRHQISLAAAPELELDLNQQGRNLQLG